MGAQKKPKGGNGCTAVSSKPVSCGDVVRSVLSKLPEIDAVFVLSADANVVHVFSVVTDFNPKLYDKLLKKERAIEDALPETAFEFHVRAHQGRPPAHAVPFDAEPVYVR